ERLGDVFADLRQLGAAAARAGGRRRVDDTPARQVLGKVPTRRLAPHEAANLDAGRLGLGLILPSRRGQFFQLQLHLIEQALAALRARAKHLAASSWRSPIEGARSAPRRRTAWRAPRSAPPSTPPCHQEDDQLSSPRTQLNHKLR